MDEKNKSMIDFFNANLVLSRSLTSLNSENLKNYMPKVESDLNKIISILNNENSCKILNLEGYNPLKGARHDLGNNYTYILSFTSLYSAGCEIPKSIGSIDNLLSKGKTIENTILSLIDEMNLSDNFEKYEHTKMKKLYEEISHLPLSINGKINIEIRDGITSENNIDIYKSAHLFRVIHNICQNKTRLSENTRVLIDIKDKEKEYSFGIYDDTGIGIPDIFTNPYDICKYGESGSKSSGIGLYVSKNLIENRMNGQFIIKRYDSHPEDNKYHGAKFELILPKKEFF